jgi:hypothetical protein
MNWMDAMAAENKRKEDQEVLNAKRGYSMTPDMLRIANASNYGRDIGQSVFYDDPDMQRLRQLREDYAKGYEGQEAGAIRQQARGEIAGSQAAAQRKLASGLARGGVGGARAASIQSAQAQQGARSVAEAERKMALDSAQMKRQGAADLQDFIFRQKYGKEGLGLGYAGLESSSYAAQQALEANKPKEKSPAQQAMSFLTLGVL